MFGRLRKSVQQEASRALRSVAAARQAALATWKETTREPEPEPYFAPILPPGVVPPPPLDWLNYVNAKLTQNFGETYPQRSPTESGQAAAASIGGASSPGEALIPGSSAVPSAVPSSNAAPRSNAPRRSSVNPDPRMADRQSRHQDAEQGSPRMGSSTEPEPRATTQTPANGGRPVLTAQQHRTHENTAHEGSAREQQAPRRVHDRASQQHTAQPHGRPDNQRLRAEPPSGATPAENKQVATAAMSSYPTAHGSRPWTPLLQRAQRWLDERLRTTTPESLEGGHKRDRDASLLGTSFGVANTATPSNHAAPFAATSSRAVPIDPMPSITTAGNSTASVSRPGEAPTSAHVKWPTNGSATARTASATSPSPSRPTAAVQERGATGAFAPHLFTFNHSPSSTRVSADQTPPHVPAPSRANATLNAPTRAGQGHSAQGHIAQGHASQSRTAANRAPASSVSHRSTESPSSRATTPTDEASHSPHLNRGSHSAPFASPRQAVVSRPVTPLQATAAQGPVTGKRPVARDAMSASPTPDQGQPRFVALTVPREFSRGRWPSLPPSDGETAPVAKDEYTHTPIDAEQRFA